MICACNAAYCKNPLNDQWYSYDDHRVSKLRLDAVVTKWAYLLFYRRRLAQTRCAVSLQQWVSSACSASYGGNVPDVTAAHSHSGNVLVFYARKQLLLSAQLLSAQLSHCNSICPSVRHTGGSVKNGAS